MKSRAKWLLGVAGALFAIWSLYPYAFPLIPDRCTFPGVSGAEYAELRDHFERENLFEGLRFSTYLTRTGDDIARRLGAAIESAPGYRDAGHQLASIHAAMRSSGAMLHNVRDAGALSDGRRQRVLEYSLPMQLYGLYVPAPLIRWGSVRVGVNPARQRTAGVEWS